MLVKCKFNIFFYFFHRCRILPEQQCQSVVVQRDVEAVPARLPRHVQPEQESH